MLPADHAITAPSRHNAPRTMLKSKVILKSLAKIKMTPTIPSNNPEIMYKLIFGLFMIKYYIPTTQNGEVLRISAVNPLGNHCSATTTNPFPTPSSKIPTTARCKRSFIPGSL